MKTVLAFDTSGPVLSVALGTKKGEIRQVVSSGQYQHTENLIPLMDDLLRKESICLAEIDAFAIDRGPGSFTGLRVGYSLLKGFLVVRKRPCHGALSLDIMADKIVLPESVRLGILMDARREAIYARFYRRKKSAWVPEKKPELLKLPQLKKRIAVGSYLAGDALVRYQKPLEDFFSGRIHFLDPECFPSSATLVKWFQANDPRLTLLRTSRDLVPLYFRAPEAEEKRREKKHGA